jgi:hypothetical protein
MVEYNNGVDKKFVCCSLTRNKETKKMEIAKIVTNQCNKAFVTRNVILAAFDSEGVKVGAILGNPGNYVFHTTEKMKSFDRPAHFYEGQAWHIVQGFKILIKHNQDEGIPVDVNQINAWLGNL